MRTFVLCVAVLLSGCSTLGGNPILQNQVVKNDLGAATANLNSAVKLGLLPADDPAVVCLNAISARAAADVSFAPEVDGLVSAGSVAYIAAQIAKKGVQIEPQCEALVGRVVLDGAKAGVRIAPVLR